MLEMCQYFIFNQLVMCMCHKILSVPVDATKVAPTRVGEREKSVCDPVLEFFRCMLTLSRWQLLSQATFMEE